jgi:hypothetical protein
LCFLLLTDTKIHISLRPRSRIERSSALNPSSKPFDVAPHEDRFAILLQLTTLATVVKFHIGDSCIAPAGQSLLACLLKRAANTDES